MESMKVSINVNVESTYVRNRCVRMSSIIKTGTGYVQDIVVLSEYILML